jgi:Flp pilus assembly protein TadG
MGFNLRNWTGKWELFGSRAASAQTLLRCDRGNTIMMTALAAPALMGCVGLATDFAMLNLKQSELQTLADSVAIAGAKEMALASSSDSDVKSVSVAYAERVLEKKSGLSVDISINRKSASLTVNVEEQWTPFFAHFIDASVTPVKASATASMAGSASICVLTLDPSGSEALRLDLLSKVNAQGCGTFSNSTNKYGLWLGLGTTLESQVNCSAGGYMLLSTKVKPKPTSDCPVIPDPLAERVEPSAGGCDVTNLVVKDTSVATLKPGTYCGGIRIEGSAQVSFAPGTYIIKNGEFRIKDKAKATGTNIAFYLTGDASLLNFTDDSTIAFSGAEDGDLAGLLFFESRSSKLGRTHRFNSKFASELTGTIYLSRGNLLIDPNGTMAEDSEYTAIIANRLEVTAGPTLVLNSDYAASDVPVPDGVIAATSEVFLTD